MIQRLNSSLKDGMSEGQIKDRLQRYGKNAPSPPPTHRFKTITGYFFKGFGSILLVASILVFVAWKPLGDPPAQANLALAIVLFAVFLIQAGFNMWQDWSSSRVMASIKNMLPDECQVIRDSAQLTLFAADLVGFAPLSLFRGAVTGGEDSLSCATQLGQISRVWWASLTEGNRSQETSSWSRLATSYQPMSGSRRCLRMPNSIGLF